MHLAQDQETGTPRALNRMPMTGVIAFMPLPILLQTLEMNASCGRLTLWMDGELFGTLWLDRGAAVDAECGDLTGAPAVYRLLALQTGHFRLDPGPADRGRVIETSTQGLLLEGMRRIDEGRRLTA